MTRSFLLFALLALLLAGFALADNPKVIHFGIASAGFGTPPRVNTGWLAVAQQGHYLEQEFQKDGIRIDWVFFKGQGPAVNEALANNQLDFSSLGDLPSVIGRSVGLDTRLILVNGRGSQGYVATRPDSPIKRVEDLRGKRIAFNKGTASQLFLDRVLAAHGMTEADIKGVNMTPSAYTAAFLAGEVDAIAGSLDILGLQQRQLARVIYNSGDDARITAAGHIVVRQKFAAQYPELTQRVVKALLKAALWASDPQNSNAVYALWTQTGYQPESVYRAEYAGVPLAERLSPVFDEYAIARDKQAVQDSLRFKLVRSGFDVNQWVDQRYQQAALKELKLEHHWRPLDANGKLVAGRRLDEGQIPHP
ncbi:sulfonate transport system substrate-binding protein [Silvimonas terrae]|uniref:Sulfonate transport system substrate-binding protein n=1 Tax=Silvimonas terrae TaxID=300266 RepID=A0A840REF6_9NEIS|nr:ABC transporter substrate-binding protein [Silvimonas terrae]MBB5190760.1 sulfonate transport system substrate-binding protein [Silvimonas terrae]